MVLRVFDLLLKSNVGLFELNPVNAVLSEFIIVFDILLILGIKIEKNFQPLFLRVRIKIFDIQPLGQLGGNLKIRFAFSKWLQGTVDKREIRP